MGLKFTCATPNKYIVLQLVSLRFDTGTQNKGSIKRCSRRGKRHLWFVLGEWCFSFYVLY
nr:MAG TPA: hypothetical protein [Caudoviricetes sp.]